MCDSEENSSENDCHNNCELGVSMEQNCDEENEVCLCFCDSWWNLWVERFNVDTREREENWIFYFITSSDVLSMIFLIDNYTENAFFLQFNVDSLAYSRDYIYSHESDFSQVWR